MNTLQLTPAGQYGVTLAPEAITARDKLVAEARKVTAVTDDLDLECAAATARELKALVTSTEKTRKQIKEPVLALGRQVDATASEYVRSVQDELTRIERLMTEYHAAQRRQAAEAEAALQRELARIESERMAAERDASHAELVRLAAQEADRREAAKDKANQHLQQAELATLDYRKAMSAKAAADAEALRVQQEKLAKAAQSVASAPVVAPTRTAGMMVRTVWDFEVLDIWKVPRDFVRIEPNREAILDAVRKGIREIPGLRIWSETKAGVR